MQAKALIPAVAVVLLLGAACSDGDDDTAKVESVVDDSGTGTNDQNDESTSGDQESGDTTDTGGTGEAGASAGSTTGELPNYAEDAQVPLRVDVTSLRHNGDLVELEMVLTVDTDEEVDFSPWNFMADETSSGYDISGVSLIDQGTSTAYFPAIDSSDVCVCSSDLNQVRLGARESTRLSATFGGLAPDTGQVDLHIPGFSPITGLAIES